MSGIWIARESLSLDDPWFLIHKVLRRKLVACRRKLPTFVYDFDLLELMASDTPFIFLSAGVGVGEAEYFWNLPNTVLFIYGVLALVRLWCGYRTGGQPDRRTSGQELAMAAKSFVVGFLLLFCWESKWIRNQEEEDEDEKEEEQKQE